MENKSSNSFKLTSTTRRQSLAFTEQISFFPFIVTCFGDYILAYLTSSSRNNYLALWGPDIHLCESQELLVESAKFCKSLPSSTITSLSLRVLFIGDLVRFVIHGISNDLIERWLLNEYGDVLETSTKHLETPIELFLIDKTGDIMISFESNFIIFRNNELRVFHSIKYGKELPTGGVIIPQLNSTKVHLITIYESGLIMGWEIPIDHQSNEIHERSNNLSQPIFQIRLNVKSPLCGIVEVINTERLHHRRLCVVGRNGQLWLLEWSTRDLSVCSEVKHLDLKKALRYQQKSKPNSQNISNNNNKNNNNNNNNNLAAAKSTQPNNLEESPSAPSINNTITILSICSCPDISYENYTPHGDRPDGITVEQWRHYQANAVSQASRYQLETPYQPSICLLTSLGSTIIVDIETFRVRPQNIINGENTMGVVSAAISSLNVLEYKFKSKRNNNNNNNNNENNDNNNNKDDNESDTSSITSVDPIENNNEIMFQSPPKSIKKNSVSGLNNYNPGSPFSQINTNDPRSQSISPSRRVSIQGGTGSANGRRGSMASAVYKPPQILANYKNLYDLHKRIANNYGSDVLLSAFSVTLGGFDRKIFIRPILLPIFQNNKKVEIDHKKVKNNREATHNPQIPTSTESKKKILSAEDIEARKEVSRLPLWAMTLKEDFSSDSITERKNIEAKSIYENKNDNNNNNNNENIIISLFHQPYFQPNNLPDSSPLSVIYNISEKPQPQSARSKTPNKLRGDWETPKKTLRGEIIDQPVTFHSKIKSSGYGVADVTTNRWKQKRQMNITPSNNSKFRSKSAPRNGNTNRNIGQSSSAITSTSRLRMYPRDCGMLTQHQEYNNFPPPVSNIKQIPILKVQFSGDGTMIGVVSAGNDVGTLRAPLGRFKGDGLYYLGHDAQVNSIDFAHKSDLIISSSADATARIWKYGRVDNSVVVFSHKRHNPMKIGSTNTTGMQSNLANKKISQSRNIPFNGAIQCASFYYLDKFALLTTKTSVLMYTYDLEDLDQENDLKRLQATGKYKLVHEWCYDTAQNLTTTSCLNTVESPTIISSSSDRKILIFDAISGKVSRIIESNHDRSIHCIALPQPSVHISIPQSNYNVFATSSTDNVISLWDIRQQQTIFRFSDHINRREKIQCSFSPCMRYLTTGSEDRTVRIIDIQSGGKQISKLSGYHRDVISSVDYHPIYPQLISGSYDGTIRCFTCNDNENNIL